MVSALLLISLTGCIERVTGVAVPLDERFYKAGMEQDQQPGQPQGDPNAGQPPGEAGAGEIKNFDGYEGDFFTLKGTINSEATDPVVVDLSVPDANEPGGQKRVGRLNLDKTGAFEVEVPEEIENLRIEAFQDADANGPSEKDPYAEVNLKLSGSDTAPVELNLKVGARGQPMGDGTGQPPPPNGAGGPAPPPQGLSFPDGPMITVRGQIIGKVEGKVILDFYKRDEGSEAGRSFLGRKDNVTSGTWEQAFPKDYGAIEVEAYIDPTGDGRSPDDIVTSYSGNPVTIASDDVGGIDLIFQ